MWLPPLNPRNCGDTTNFKVQNKDTYAKKFKPIPVQPIRSNLSTAMLRYTTPLLSSPSLRCWTSTILLTTTSQSPIPASSCWRFHATPASQFSRRSCAMPSTSANQLTPMTMLEWTYRYSLFTRSPYWCLGSFSIQFIHSWKKDRNLLPIRLALIDSLLVKSYGLYNTVGSALSACVVTYLGERLFLSLSRSSVLLCQSFRCR